MKSESEVTQSYPTLSDPMDCSLPASSINGIFQQEYWRGVPLPSPQLSYFTDFRLFLILPSIHSWQLSSPSFLHLPLLQECESRHVADTRDVKVAQSCPTLCDTIDLYSPWDSPCKITAVVCHCRLQCMKVKSDSEVISHVRLLSTPWTAAYQAPPSMGFSRQEYWSGLPLPSPASV